ILRFWKYDWELTDHFPRWILLLVLGGVAFGIYLTAIEVFVIQAICLFCLFAFLLMVATAPVAVAGLMLQSQVATGTRQIGLIAATSILFGLLLGWADRRCEGGFDLASFGWTAALVVGLAQALSLVPGTSRAGVTITAGLLVGLSRPAAVRFAFLLAVPVGLLVGAKNLFDLTGGEVEWGVELAIGFLVSGLSAYLAIRWLLGWVRRHDLTTFVVYRVILGLALLTQLAV
ncbi:MAG: undecaprenyl-diphosphate phosphatase, partial [Thermoanaerobaculia bacterium]